MTEKPKAVMGILKRMNKGRTFLATFEFPGEDANELFEWFGKFPDDGESRWFGIAHIDEVAAKAHMLDKTNKTAPKVLTDAQRAISGSAAMAKKLSFCRWANDVHKANILNEDEALVWIRQITGVESRSEYKDNIAAREQWFAIAKAYASWAAQPEDISDD